MMASRQDNIVVASGKGPLNVDAGHPAVFKDENPDCPADARYKAILRSSRPENGLLAVQVARRHPLVADERGTGPHGRRRIRLAEPRLLGSEYRQVPRLLADLHRRASRPRKSGSPAGHPRHPHGDFGRLLIHWEPHADLTYVDSPAEQLYTNQIKPYYRAPHILIGFPDALRRARLVHFDEARCPSSSIANCVPRPASATARR